jgi:Na+/melibiose symporter-like transporter
MSIQRSGRATSLDIDEIHDNTSQELISITADKLKLILIENLEQVKSTGAWQMPLSLLITIVLVFCSAEFKLALGVSADTWRAVFSIGGVACLIWLIVCLFKPRKSKTLDEVISVIKNKTKSTVG